MLHFKTLRLSTQLILFFLILIGIVLSISGFYIDWQLRRVIENEIAQRLITIARLTASEASQTQIFNLFPGDENSRTAQRLTDDLRPYFQHTGISRLVITDPDFRAFFDSAQQLNIGDDYFRMRFDATEIEMVLAEGQARAAKLFEDQHGAPFKAAYAPVIVNSQMRAIVCVEGSAVGLVAVQETRSILFTIGFFALVVATLAAYFIARQITRPIEKLEHAAKAIARAKYDQKIEVAGSSEVVFLSQTIDDMRKAIAQRHQQQQMMLAGIAHEIRNPLGGIELFAGLLQKKSTVELKPSIDKILSEVQHLKQIVTDFLAYARPVEPKKQNVDLENAVREVQELLGNGTQSIEWQIDIEKSLTIHADPDHLRQIFTNLLQNACQALTEQEHAGIAIFALQKQKQVEITIRDNGPGIAEDIRDRIFQPFFTTRHEGTGLGLALVKLLVEENSGSIELVSGKLGCEFKISLPSVGTEQNN